MRRATPAATGRRHGVDPLLTVERAEEYVRVGRIDRAVRVYRRLIFHAPENERYARRLAQLEGYEFAEPDDLSEELTADIFDHLISSLPEFGLDAFQEPAGRDLKILRASS